MFLFVLLYVILCVILHVGRPIQSDSVISHTGRQTLRNGIMLLRGPAARRYMVDHLDDRTADGPLGL